MDVMKTLEGYRSAVIEMDVIQLQIDRLSTIGGPAGIRSASPRMERVPEAYLTPAERHAGIPVYTPTPRGSNNSEATRESQIRGAEQRLAEARTRAETYISDFETLMNAISGTRGRATMRLYYMEGKNLDEVGNIMRFSAKTASRILKAEIQLLREKFQNNFETVC